MNEELINEDKVFSAWLNDAATSIKCVWTAFKPEFITRLARMYFEEMDKPKAWDGAPEDAFQAQITWFTENGGFTGIKTFTREPPKTRARQIAEKEGHRLAEKYGWNTAAKELVTNVMEAALSKYEEELKEASHDK